MLPETKQGKAGKDDGSRSPLDPPCCMLLFHKQQGVDETNLGLKPAQLLDVPSIVVYLSAE